MRPDRSVASLSTVISLDLRDRWATLESGRVTGLTGVTLDDVERVVDQLPAGPFPLHYLISSGVTITVPQIIVDHVIDQLRTIVCELVEQWLAPTGTTAPMETTAPIETVAREVAVATGRSSQHITAIARWCVGIGPEPDLAPPVALRTYAALTARAYGRRALALTVSRSDDGPALPREQQDLLAHAANWLAGHGGIAVVLIDNPLPLIDRFRAVDIIDRPVRRATGPGIGLTAVIRPISGRPSPTSVAEKSVETALARASWSSNRQWNVQIHIGPLEPTPRVDIAWQAERVVVEIDGPDHRSPRKYEDDRARDNRLHCAGWTVLRFTNDQVDADVASVVSTIETLVRARRANGLFGSTMNGVNG